MSEFHTIKSEEEDLIEEVKDHVMNIEDSTKMETKTRKRSLSTMMDEGHIQIPEELYKKKLSLTKPSYALRHGLGAKNVRWENRNRLHYLLHKLLSQRDWVNASGVLSVLLKATSKEKCLVANRLKYTVLMELLDHINSDCINQIRIKNIYDIWMKRIAAKKDSPLEDKFVVHLEFILFCLTQGDLTEAHQAAMSLMQERGFGNHPMSNMVMALTFYQRWYSSIPEDMQWKDSDRIYSPRLSNFSEMRSNHQVENSEPRDTVYSYKANTHFRCDSDTSVTIGKTMSMEDDSEIHKGGPMEDDESLQRANISQHFQRQSLYVNSTENEDSFLSDGGPVDYGSMFAALEALDSWLLPVRVANSDEDYENYIRRYRKLLNDDYKNAVKYFRLALHLMPPISAALFPLVQLLLIGGHVDEALNELEKFCINSETVLPVRLKASLLKCFDRNNYVILLACFEDILKKDPTCCQSLASLSSMHHNGNYSLEPLLEMIALHLDATHADYRTWREFALCFLKVSQCEEDRMSVFLNENEGGRKKFSTHYDRAPNILTEGKSGKAWMLRCKWWLHRHFSKNMLTSEIAAGDLELLTYKASCACHLYGPEVDYVVKAYSQLEKENNRDLFMFLQTHRQNSIKLCSYF